MNIINLRNLSYQEVRDKLSEIAAKNQLKKKEKNRNNDTVYAAESIDKSKEVKDKTQIFKINLKLKKNASKIECIYYKKRYPTTK